jgi:cell division septum initiation protein DivIVA
MSIREQEAPDFSNTLRGYDRVEVDEYVAWLRNHAALAEEQASRAEAALAQCRRELASTPTTTGISQRLAAMLQLATEEADEIRARARADSDTMTRDATNEAARTIDDANRQRDAIQREIDDLTAVREQLLQRLIELGGEVLGATERFRGYAPGTVPLSEAKAELYDDEADASAAAVPGVVDEGADDEAVTISER